MNIFKSLFLSVVLLFMTQSQTFCNTLSIIRDTEMEEYALTGIKKLFDIGGLNGQKAKVVFINDTSINAFITSGSTVFIHTGLLMQSDTPDEFFGVLAHETGHIIGGHSVRLQQEYQRAQTTALISTLLGSLAAIASGRADVGMAIISGSLGSIQGMMGVYRQSEENAADSIAVDILEKSPYSPIGLLNIMSKIQKEERLIIDDTPSYWRSHPLTRDRILFLEAHHFKEKEHHDEAFDRIKAKVYAFSELPEQTLSKYNDASLVSLYAQSIALFKQSKIAESLEKVDKLLEMENDNPYFHELKGQILFEAGRLNEAVESNRRAVELLPKATLIRLSLAHVLLETNKKENIDEAVSHLEKIVATDRDFPENWWFLHIAYAKQGKKALSDYAKVEYDFLIGNKKDLTERIQGLKKSLKNDTVKYNHLLDMEDALTEKE